MNQDSLLNEIANLKEQLKVCEQEMRRLRAKEMDLYAKTVQLEAINQDFHTKFVQAIEEVEKLKRTLTFRLVQNEAAR